MASLWLSHGSPMSGATFWTHPDGFLKFFFFSKLAHVGSDWGHLGSGWLPVGPKMAQDRSMLAQVRPKTPR